MDEIRENIEDHYDRPRHHGALTDAQVIQRQENPLCGDRVTVYLAVSDGVVNAMQWEGRGCTISQAAASMLSEAVIGKPVAEVQQLGEQWMVDLIGAPLNPARRKCANLGLKAVQLGLAQLDQAAA